MVRITIRNHRTEHYPSVDDRRAVFDFVFMFVECLCILCTKGMIMSSCPYYGFLGHVLLRLLNLVIVVNESLG